MSVVHLAHALLDLQMAFGASPQQATPTGALEYIATTAGGTTALIVLGVGLLAYAVGRVLEATTLAGHNIDGKQKAIAFVLALIYVSLAVSAFSLAGLAG